MDRHSVKIDEKYDTTVYLQMQESLNYFAKQRYCSISYQEVCTRALKTEAI